MVFMHLKRQRACRGIQRSQYVDPLALNTDIGTVGFAQWRPTALHVGYIANTGFLKVQQFHCLALLLGGLSQLIQTLRAGKKVVRFEPKAPLNIQIL